MANLPATLWATNAGSGLKDGTSLANSAVVDPADADDILSIVNAGTVVEPVTIRQVDDASITQTLNVTLDATSTNRITWQGRNAGDTADAEVDIDAGAGAFSVFTLTVADFWDFRHIHATNTSKAAGFDGWSLTNDADECSFFECRASECYRGFDLAAGASGIPFLCSRAHGNANIGFNLNSTSWASESAAHDNGSDGFVWGRQVRCLSYGNGGNGYHVLLSIVLSIAYDNTSQGFRQAGVDSVGFLADCIAAENGAFGFNAAGANRSLFLLRCADFNNTSGRDNSGVQGNFVDEGPIVLTADPFVNAAGGVFDLNKVIGGGADCHELGGILMPGGLTTSYHSRGVAQPPLGGILVGMSGGLQ